MKTKKTAAAVLAGILLSLLACGLSGCTTLDAMLYENADRYSAGNTVVTGEVTAIDVDWGSGKVNLAAHAGETVSVEETLDDSAKDNMRVHWWLDGTTLRIKFAASGFRFSYVKEGQKELTLLVPSAIPLANVTIRTTSADVNASYFRTDTLNISTASGGMNVECDAREIRLSSASGGVYLDPTAAPETVSVSTVSGEIRARLNEADKGTFESTSGKIELDTGAMEELSVKSVSGSIRLEADEVPRKGDFRSTSGGVALYVPKGSGFTATVRSFGGRIDSDISLKRDGSVYTSGDGSAVLLVETKSGDVELWLNEKG